MDKIEVFIRNVLSAWTLLLFIQKAASTLFTKSKVKKSAILCCAYGALGVIARCWFTYNIIFIFTLTLLVFATMKTCCIKWLQSICFSVVILCIWLIMLLMRTCVGACIQFLLKSAKDTVPFFLSLPFLLSEIWAAYKFIPFKKLINSFANKYNKCIILLLSSSLLCCYFGIRALGIKGVYTAVPLFFLAFILIAPGLLLIVKTNHLAEQETRRLARENHDYKKYIPALKAAFNNEENLPAENSGALRYELSLLLEEAHRNTARAALEAQAYPPTGLILLDILLEEKVRECREKQILFSGCVLESPRFLLGHPIGLQPLLAVIANLVDNAIRAVSHPCVKEKMIVLHFGQAAGRIYQITIADSGIPFTIRTLENLGAVGNTTGGSGYGIASIIETCQKVHASVKLTEYGEHVTGFSKKICISFSGQFRIEIISPRWKELRPKYGYITVTQP